MSISSSKVIDSKSIVEALLLCKDGEEEIVIMKALSVSRKRLESITKTLFKDLFNDVDKSRELTLTPYGSTVCGHTLINSTLDIHVGCNNSKLDSEYTPNNILSIIEERLKKGSFFNNIVLINNHKKFIKCFHLNSGMEIAITTSPIPSQNRCKFTSNLMDVDKRIRPLIIILKSWAVNCGILKTNKLSTYGFIWLILLFLQRTRENPILPEFSHFIKFDIDNNDVRFDSSYEHTISNTSTIQELIVEFFTFYSKIELDAFIVLEQCFYTSYLMGDFIHFVNSIHEYQIEHIGNGKVYAENPIEINRIYNAVDTDTFFHYFHFQIRFAMDIFSNQYYPKKMKYLLLLDYLQPQLDFNNEINRNDIHGKNLSNLIIRKTFETASIKFLQIKKDERTTELYHLKNHINIDAHRTISLLLRIFRSIYKIEVNCIQSFHSPIIQNDFKTYVYYRLELSSSLDLWTNRLHKWDVNGKNYFTCQKYLTNLLKFQRNHQPEYQVNLKCSLNILVRSNSNRLSIEFIDHSPGNAKNKVFDELYEDFVQRIYTFLDDYPDF